MTFNRGSGVTAFGYRDPEPAPEAGTGPVAVSFSPPADATDVNASTNLIAEFDKAVTLGVGHVMLSRSDDNAIVEAWDVMADAGTGAGQVNVFQATQLTMRLSASIEAATEHYVVWDGGVIKDLAGNPVAEQMSPTLWAFTTAAS